MKFNYSKIAIILFFASFFSILPACDREERIQYVYVDFVVYLDLPEFTELKTPGNYLYVTGGVRGIILYCDFTDSYKAYERNCPYDHLLPMLCLMLIQQDYFWFADTANLNLCFSMVR
jgi:hypothetical protein